MRWSNIPVPEPHVVALVGAAVLHAVVPIRIPVPAATRRWLGVAMAAAGAGLAAWAVASAGETDVECESALVTSGAYAMSRNPMYLGWSVGVLGAALASGSAWLLVGWLLAVRAVDREIDAEEARLLRGFGATYAAYRAKVPRYLRRPLWQPTATRSG